MNSSYSPDCLEHYVPIPKDLSKSENAKKPANRQLHSLEMKNFGESRSYSLVNTCMGYRLSANFISLSSPDLIKPVGSYDFVVVRKNNAFQMRIRKLSHYFLANEADYVYMAGQITFDEHGKITSCDDQSGCYHIDQWESESKRQAYRNSILSILKHFDIPQNHFTFVMDREKKPSVTSSSLFGFSSNTFFNQNKFTLITGVAIGVSLLYGMS